VTVWYPISAKLHYTDTGYGHVVEVRTPPTEELTTILQLVVQKICHIAMPEPNISTCQDVGMWQILSVGSEFVVQQLTCRIVLSSSVGGVVQHVRSRCPCSGVWH